MPQPSLFHSWEWYDAWLESAGKNSEICIFLARDEEKILAIAPLYRKANRVARLPYYEIRFLSTIQVARSPLNITGTQDILYNPQRVEILKLFLAYIFNNLPRWQIIRLHPMPSESATGAIIKRFCDKQNLHYEEREILQNACLVIRQGWESYYQGLSANFRKNLRRAKKKLDELRNYKIIEFTRLDSVDEAFIFISQIEQSSWKSHRGVTLIEENDYGFYRILSKKCAVNGWLLIIVLFIDEQPAAYDLHINYNGYVKTLKGSYDERFAEYSPGVLLSLFAHEKFFRDGIKEIDLLWENFDYKLKWTNTISAHFRFLICNRGLYSGIIYYLIRSKAFQQSIQTLRNLVK